LTSPKLGWQEGDLSAVIGGYEKIVQPNRWKFDDGLERKRVELRFGFLSSVPFA
jgi:hypothetical protein